MPDAPWQCSACGTINEPVANSCRGCGRWPSLFDLEASTLEPTEAYEGATGAEELAEPTFEQPVFEPEPADLRGEIPLDPADVPVPVEEDDGQPETPGWRKLLTSAIVPIAFVVYLLISIFFSDGG